MISTKRRGHSHLTAIALAALIGCTVYKHSAPTSAALQGQSIRAGSDLRNVFVTHQGTEVSFDDYRGTSLVLVLGYISCPDVCPTTLQRWQQVFQSLPEQAAEQLQLLMLTVDPARDTPALLGQYLAHFDPRFVGLSSDSETLSSLLSELHTFARKVPSRVPGQYNIDHSGSAYLINTEGQWVDEVPFNADSQATLLQLTRLLENG